MSSLPGAYLESFVAWEMDLVVEGRSDANQSRMMAEAMGMSDNLRPRITEEQFKQIVDQFEPYRNQIENRLVEYNEEDNGSWKDYAGYAFDFIPDELYEQVRIKVKEICGTLSSQP